MSTDITQETELIGNVKKNIAWILEKNYDNSQTLMARDLEVKTNTLYTYINTETKPPLAFICKLCRKNGLSLDSFVYDNLKLLQNNIKKKEAIKKAYSKYREVYYVYFFVVDSNSLKEGLIQEGKLSINDIGDVSFELLNSKKMFSGKVSISDELTYFDLRNNKEKFSITIKSPGKNIKEKYVGGIGITNISSPEDNRIPCAQKIIISSVKIPIDKYYIILREFLTISTHIKIKKNLLCNLLTKTINIDDYKYEKLSPLVENNKISGEDKIIIDKKHLNLLQDVLDKEEYLQLKSLIYESINTKDVIPFSSIKISLEEDNLFYRFIKNEFNIPSL